MKQKLHLFTLTNDLLEILVGTPHGGFYTLPYFLRKTMQYVMENDRYIILAFFHALMMHGDVVIAFCIRSSSWRGYIEASFHFTRLQSTKLKDSWKAIYCILPPFLESKQFREGRLYEVPLAHLQLNIESIRVSFCIIFYYYVVV